MDKSALHGTEKFYFQKRIVRIAALAMAAVLAVIFSLAFGMDFDVEHAIFESGSVLGAIAFYGNLALSAGIAVLPVILIKREKQAEDRLPLENQYHNYYTLDNAFIKTLRIAIGVFVAVQGCIAAAVIGMKLGSYPLLFLLAVLSIVLALYFVPELTAMLGSVKIHLGCGTVGLLWFLVMTFTSYFDRTYPLASRYMVLSQVGYLLAMLALTYELRYRFDGSHIRVRLATLCSAFVFNSGFSVGKLVMLITVGQVNFGDTAASFVMLAMSVYFGARIFFYSED